MIAFIITYDTIVSDIERANCAKEDKTFKYPH